MLIETHRGIHMSNKLEQIAVRLEPELREKLQQAADQDMRPLAGLIRKILHEAIVAGPAASTSAGAR
jgi:hypothetical protein